MKELTTIGEREAVGFAEPGRMLAVRAALLRASLRCHSLPGCRRDLWAWLHCVGDQEEPQLLLLPLPSVFSGLG